VHDCIEFRDGEGPASYQDEILSTFGKERRMAIRSPHGVGKTTTAAWIILAFILTNEMEDFKCATTASAWRQLTRFLWPEIHKWIRKIKWGKIGRDPFTNQELLTETIKLKTGQAFAIASDKSDLIEGAHADKLLYVLDESKSIPEGTWDAVEGAFASGDCFALAISTPGVAFGRFYDIHRKRKGLTDWWTRKITKEEAIAAGRVNQSWIDQMRDLWGENNPVYVAKVEANFPSQEADQLISLADIEAARERELEAGEPKVAGQDVARFGDDDSVYIEREGPVVTHCRMVHGQDTQEVASHIKVRGVHTNIDGIGVGAGVCDGLKHLEYRDYTEVIVSEKARRDPEHFANLLAELCWNMKTVFEEGNIDLSRLPDEIYNRLIGELVTIKTEYRNGKIYVQSKEEQRKQMRRKNITARSRDIADALMLCFADLRGVKLAEVELDPEESWERPSYAMFRRRG
jgi:hypothetical protein